MEKKEFNFSCCSEESINANDEGYTKCPLCDGDGWNRCGACNGTGIYGGDTCEYCDGSGKVACENCREGYVACYPLGCLRRVST